MAVSHLDVIESPEEVLSTLTRDGKRKWMYPTPTDGYWARRRKWVAWFLIVLFIALPVVPINGRPAILLDFIHREFAVFGIVFFPTDTLFLMLFMIGTMLAIFLFTALLGRVWCGWACPQTVYMEFLYRPVERWIEGKELVRKKRDAGPWVWDKIWRKTLKNAIFLVFSLVLAHTFVAYFSGWERLLQWMQQAPTEHWAFFLLMGGTTGLMLFNFGYFREQMCTIACPYARLQSVLLDQDSLIVSYDPNRGEPRSRRNRILVHSDDRGDCVDCRACVRTCPTGIDIRDGLQMECIACTQCVDACDDIMTRLNLPTGLIRYTSEHELAGRKTRRIRPRTVLYAVLILIITSLITGFLINRGSFEANVFRAVGDPFMVLPDGRIANRVKFQVRNQDTSDATFVVEVVRPANAELNIVGMSPVSVKKGEVLHTEAWIVVSRDALIGGQAEASFMLVFSNGYVVELPFTLLGPNQREGS